MLLCCFQVCLVWLLLGFASASASTQFHVQTWTTENGLPQNIVMDTCQAPDGYLWLATLDGLVRFDGVRFTTFDHSNTAGIPGNQFNSVYCSPTGEVWAGTVSTGATRYKQGAFRTYGANEGLRPGDETRVTGDDAGHLWAFRGSAVQEWDPALSRFVAAAGLQGRFEGDSDPSGSFHALDRGELRIFSKGKLTRYSLPAGKDWQAPRMVARDMNETVWICDSRARLRFLQRGAERWSDPMIPTAANVGKRTFTFRDARGDGWSFVVDYSFGGTLMQTILLPEHGDVSQMPVNNLWRDRDGNYWVATNGRGLSRIREQMVKTLSTQEGLPDGNVYPVFQDHTGDIWIGSGGLARYHAGQITRFHLSGVAHEARITSIGEDSAGGIWVGMYGGVYRGVHGRFAQIHPPALSNGAALQVIYQDPNGPLWFGTSAGLVQLQQGTWTTVRHEDGLATDDVRVILRGREGALWVGGYGGLTRLRDGRFQRWTQADGLPSNSIRSLYEDADGVLWIGTYDGGLASMEDGHLTRYTVRDGLFSSGVFQILEDDRGNLWMSSNRGVYRVAKRELKLFAHGELKVFSAVHYGKAEGMRNEECNGGFAPAGIRARDGKLWFPTQDGVAIFDPHGVQADLRAPPVLIESLQVDRMARPLDRAVRIDPGQDSVDISYTAPTLSNPEQVQFRYQLVGLDREWVDASARRTAYYAHLPPGEYEFKVIAGSAAGLWSREPAAVHLSVLPRLYQRAWFAWLLAIVGLLSLLLLWRLRTLQFERVTLRQQNHARQLIALQEGERKRIAGEMHDSLGQHLLMIKNWAALAVRNADSQTPHASLVQISETASLAIQEVREIAHNLRPLQLERLGVTTAIKDLVQQVAGSSAINFTARIAHLDGFFPPEAEMSIYRICQESLNNIIRHSEATEATILVDSDEGMVHLVIGDNGRGFSVVESEEDHAQGSGFGMLGIAERVKMLGGRLSVTSSPATGTVLRVTIPAQQRVR